MKITGFFLLICCLHVSAASSSQTITLHGKNLSLKTVFSIIEKQTGYYVSGNADALKDARSVTVTAEDMPLRSFLSLVFRNQPLDYYMEGKDILVVRKNEKLSTARKPEEPVDFPLTGRVIDSAGNALSGATIRTKKGNAMTVTDNNGAFSLDVNAGDVIVISYVGYITEELKVTGNVPLLILLKPANTEMSEVAITVNTGYQTISRERATGSFATIGSKRLENKLRPDMKAALEGLAAGMVLTKENNIEIRGISTFNTSERAPLIVVDGYPLQGGLETLNIDNIENITILKDAVAASIYGARSSNGVIVVTTKQGKKGALNVGYNLSGGMVLKPDLSYLNRTGSADYVDAEIELYNENPASVLSRYNNYGYLSRVNYLMMAKAQGLIPAAEVDAEIEMLRNSDGFAQVQDYLFRNQLTQQHNISLSGGNERSQTSASARYINNRGNTLYNSDERMILDIRNDWKASEHVSLRLFTNVNYSTSRTPVRSITDFTNHHSNTTIHPYDLLLDPATGQPQDIFMNTPRVLSRYANYAGLKPADYNPFSDLGMEMSRNQNLQFRVGGNISLKLAKGLTLDGGGAWTRGNSFTRAIYGKDSYRMRIGFNNSTSLSNPIRHYIPDGDMLTESRNLNQAYTLRAQLNYNATFGKHSIIALAGSELNRDILDNNSYPTRFGYNDLGGTFATFNYADFNAGLFNADMLSSSGMPQSPVSIGQLSFRDNRFVSWYANGSYEYDKRFLVSSSIRIDQTNFFGTDPRYRYKPLWSAGATYKISNEKFYHIPWLSRLYLRGSYGINGNVSLNSGPFLIISSGSFSNLTGDISYLISSPPNNSLRWEKTATTNLAVDLSVLSRLNVSFDYYLRKSSDLLAADAVDPTLGYTSLTKNVGQINNTGLELTVEGDALRKGKLTWNVLGTVSFNRNKVVTYNVNYLYPTSLTPTSVNRVGYPANALFSYMFSGIDANGNVEFLNAAGEKIPAAATALADVEYSGTLRPKFVYSLTNTLRYGSFDLAFMFIAKTGHVLRRNTFAGNNIQHADVAKRWRKPGDEKTVIHPRLTNSSLDFFYFPYADIFVESGNYLKLRDASLTYHISRALLRKLGVAGASLTFQGRNLFLLAANSNGVDPEAYELNAADPASAELGFTPLRPSPEYYLGLRVNF